MFYESLPPVDNAQLVFKVWDRDATSRDDAIGTAKLRLQKVLEQPEACCRHVVELANCPELAQCRHRNQRRRIDAILRRQRVVHQILERAQAARRWFRERRPFHSQLQSKRCIVVSGVRR